MVGKGLSKQYSVLSGIPWGSCLGPVLLFFNNRNIEALKKSKCNVE
jgi:hypothetical protein